MVRPTLDPASTRTTAVVTTDAEGTRDLGRRLATVATPGDVLCLWGELGAGKTQLAKGFAAGLGVTTTVNSPSFILMAEHPGRLPLFHLDLYRLADASDALAGGLIDARQAEGVTLVEWPDRLGAALPRRRVDVRIDGTGTDPRRLTIEATDAEFERYVEAAG